MALIPSILGAQLQQLESNKPSDRSVAAGRWADAYETYARTALASVFPAVLTGAEKQLFRAAILPLFLSPSSGSAPAMAAAFYQGVLQFWTTPPVLFGGNPVTVPPLPILIPQLSALFANTRAPSGAQQVALALHACTITTQVLVTPPGSLFPLL